MNDGSGLLKIESCAQHCRLPRTFFFLKKLLHIPYEVTIRTSYVGTTSDRLSRTQYYGPNSFVGLLWNSVRQLLNMSWRASTIFWKSAQWQSYLARGRKWIYNPHLHTYWPKWVKIRMKGASFVKISTVKVIIKFCPAFYTLRLWNKKMSSTDAHYKQFAQNSFMFYWYKEWLKEMDTIWTSIFPELHMVREWFTYHLKEEVLTFQIPPLERSPRA